MSDSQQAKNEKTGAAASLVMHDSGAKKADGTPAEAPTTAAGGGDGPLGKAEEFTEETKSDDRP